MRVLLTTTSYQNTPAITMRCAPGRAPISTANAGPLLEIRMLELAGDFVTILCDDDGNYLKGENGMIQANK